jgi:hypothetical protein
MTKTLYSILFAVIGVALTWWSKRPAADTQIPTKGTDTLATTSADRQGDAQRITM